MQYQNSEFKDKLTSFIRSPFSIMIGIFLVISIGIIFFFIYQQNNPSSNFVYESSTEIDPASGETIITDNNEPEEVDPVMFLGFGDFLGTVFNSDQYGLFQAVIQEYSDSEITPSLKRVSLVKDSLSFPSFFAYQFSVVINTNQETLEVVFDESGSPNTIDNVKFIFRKNGEEVWSY